LSLIGQWRQVRSTAPKVQGHDSHNSCEPDKRLTGAHGI
jgi:hypothetical protein